MACGNCGHKARPHAMGRCYEGAGPNGLTVCGCSGWSPASSRAADYLCGVCKVARGFEWLGGQVVCWPCWRDAGRQGGEPMLAPGPLVKRVHA